MALRMLLAPVLIAAVMAPADAQQATNRRDARRAYGSRLDQQAVPEVSGGVVQRVASRLETRLQTRLATRIERYNAAGDPAGSLRVRPDDGSRAQTIVQAPLPPPDGGD